MGYYDRIAWSLQSSYGWVGLVGLGSLTTSAGAMVDWFPVCGGGLGTLITAMVDWPPRVQFMISQVPPNVHLSTKSHSGLDWNICPPTFTFHKPWWMMNKMILWTQWMMSMLNINGEWMSEWREEFSFSFINLGKEGEKWNLIVDLSQYVVGLNIVTGWRWWGLLKIYAKRYMTNLDIENSESLCPLVPLFLSLLEARGFGFPNDIKWKSVKM